MRCRAAPEVPSGVPKTGDRGCIENRAFGLCSYDRPKATCAIAAKRQNRRIGQRSRLDSTISQTAPKVFWPD
jgi:hypothetical protein